MNQQGGGTNGMLSGSEDGRRVAIQDWEIPSWPAASMCELGWANSVVSPATPAVQGALGCLPCSKLFNSSHVPSAERARASKAGGGRA